MIPATKNMIFTNSPLWTISIIFFSDFNACHLHELDKGELSQWFREEISNIFIFWLFSRPTFYRSTTSRTT